MASTTDSPAIVGIGEALFDEFGDHAVLGGAPLNFAVHAHALLAPKGLSAAVVSRVGKDELGTELLVEIGRRGMRGDWIQVDEQHPTGRAIVTIDEAGEPHYEIVRDVAWDFLEMNDRLESLARETRIICFSTLAQRSQVSNETIDQFVAASTGIRLFDINLRQSYFTKPLVEKCLRSATHVKLNRGELMRVINMFSLDDGDDLSRAPRHLIERFGVRLVAVTRGREGTVLFTEHETIEGTPSHYEPDPRADSVGAGDACAAGLAVGLLLEWDLRRVVSLANDCGAFAASQPGATPRLPRELLVRHGLVALMQ